VNAGLIAVAVVLIAVAVDMIAVAEDLMTGVMTMDEVAMETGVTTGYVKSESFRKLRLKTS
jgi:hypothetical protein